GPDTVGPGRRVCAAGARAAVRGVAARGGPLIVIGNRPGVAGGRVAPQAPARVHTRLGAMFAEAGARLAGFYWCPHDPRGTVAAYSHACACRKPQPGLLLQAAREHRVDLGRSWFIGDILDDVEAGNRAGCRTVLLDVGNETEGRSGPGRTPTVTMPDLEQAARHVARAMAEAGREAA